MISPLTMVVEKTRHKKLLMKSIERGTLGLPLGHDELPETVLTLLEIPLQVFLVGLQGLDLVLTILLFVGQPMKNQCSRSDKFTS